MSDDPTNHIRQSDHDAIVTLVSEVRQVRDDVKAVKDDIKELKDNFATRVDILESGKLDRDEALRLKSEADDVHKDLNTRVTRLERAYLIGAGIIIAVEFYLRYFNK